MLFAVACGGDDDSSAAAASGGSSLSPPTGSNFFDTSAATTTASGLMYIDETVGTGDSPTMSQSVTVNYTGRLASNGTVFDSTTGRGPATFALTRVIPGFSEGILTMKTGGKRTVYIPAKLAYGANPPPGIPANADLIFDIELISIQ
jgi:FKBP-type peptidyl-prolyl cis-trans isomerase FkpA